MIWISFSLEDVSLIHISKNFTAKIHSSFIISKINVIFFSVFFYFWICIVVEISLVERVEGPWFLNNKNNKTKTATCIINWVSSICRYCAKLFTCVILFNFYIRGKAYYSHFNREKLKLRFPWTFIINKWQQKDLNPDLFYWLLTSTQYCLWRKSEPSCISIWGHYIISFSLYFWRKLPEGYNT